jgi:hypothetical protein
MRKEIDIVVPKDWSAVTFRQYLDMKKDLETYKDEEDATVAVLFHHLCKFPVEYIQDLDVKTFTLIKQDLLGFLGSVELPLKKFIQINGVEYGFEPNLSQMSYGAYVDISKYETIEANETWAEILSILYRPVVKKQGKLYEIQKYSANLDKEKFLNIPMDIVWGSIFFFVTLQRDLLKSIQNSLMQSTEIPPNIKSTLERSGNLTLR